MMLEKVSENHKDWLNIAQSFLSKEDAEDVVQDLYLTLHKYNIKEAAILYGDEINRGFIYIVLTNMIKNRKIYNERQKRDSRLNVNIDEIKILVEDIKQDNDIYDKIQDEVNTWPQYDRSLFEIYMYSGLSLRELSNGSKKVKDIFISNRFKLRPESIKRGTGISVTSIFHTITNCKQKIKQKLNGNIKRT